MPQLTSAGNLSEILSLLRVDPEILQLSAQRINIAVTFSSVRKRFTDFHRIEVTDWHGDTSNYWIRTIKNKPAEVAEESLNKQYRIQSELFAHLSGINLPSLQLSCSEPVALLTEYNTIITKECRGQLFNTNLVRSLPYFHRKELTRTFQNVGIWLKVFHNSFREETQPIEQAELLRRFDEQFGRPVREEFSFATLCHFDYSPRNIFVDRNFIQVIDFVGSVPGIAQTDIEFFCDYIRESRINGLYSRSQKEIFVEAFLDGYRNCVVSKSIAKHRFLPAYTAAAV